MWGPLRQSLIDGHLFYVEQARKRLLSQFENIEKEAEEASEEWLKNSSHRFNPDSDDPGSFYETAHDVGIEFYQLLSEMRDQTRLSVVSGLFHEWEKQLRTWLVGEVRHWHRGDTAISKIWSADFGKIVELLTSLGWNIQSTDYFKKIDACRLVVNVYKHGKGKSLYDLKQNHPEYLRNPLGDLGEPFSDKDFLDHTHLTLSDEQFQAFSEAIVEFWRGVPESIPESQVTSVPDWFGKALLKK